MSEEEIGQVLACVAANSGILTWRLAIKVGLPRTAVNLALFLLVTGGAVERVPGKMGWRVPEPPPLTEDDIAWGLGLPS